MKKTLLALTILGFFMVPQQESLAWEYNGISSLNPMPALSYLNPLPYIGIGENKTNFSLNPFTGFKNCNKCKVKKVKCDECTRVTLNTCPTCTRAFNETCDTCERIYLQPVQPRCPCMINH